jgi:hypothetical protein
VQGTAPNLANKPRSTLISLTHHSRLAHHRADYSN